MTKKEWINRCAAQYQKQTGIGKGEAIELAKNNFNLQEGEFCPSENYSPEDCAEMDLEMTKGLWPKQ